MNDIAEQIRQILTFIIAQEMVPEIVAQDIDLSGADVFTPHLHQGLELKLLGVAKKDALERILQWKTMKTVVIPAQIVHSSTRPEGLLSLLIEKNKITFVYERKMLSEAIPIAAIADLGVVASAVVNFIQSAAVSEPLSPQLTAHAAMLLKTLFSSLVIVLGKSGGGEPEELTARAVNYINRNYYRHKLSVEDVAAYVGVTANYLVSRFHKENGLTIRQYLMKTRLAQARLLLQSGRCMVQDAARLTGWNSAYYFSNCYRRHFGIPPSKAQYKE